MPEQYTVEILVVEDDPHDLEMTLTALRRDKITNRIEVARDGEEALDYLFRRGVHAGRRPGARPRLILLDLKLPKVDGLEVLREIRETPETRSIPVVVMTSSAEQKDLVETYRLGVNSYIQKPLDTKHFRETVNAVGFYWLMVNQPPPEEC
jgi:two-component system, response regulator